MIHVSVIICCYNSENVIKETLKHLALQETEGLNFEIILVDNNCTDNTVKVAKTEWTKYNVKTELKIVREPKLGTSNARVHGVNNSKSDLIIFCDDDNWLHENYINVAYRFMISHPEVGALVGQSIGVLEEEKPEWWDKYMDGYAVGKQSNKSGDITKRGFVWGAGMVLRKELYTRLFKTGFNYLLSGRKGELLSSGEDSEICKWVILMGYKLWYLDTLRFKHYITKERLRKIYLKKLLEGHKNSWYILKSYDALIYYGYCSKIYLGLKLKSYYAAKAIKFYLKKDFINCKRSLQLTSGTHLKIEPSLHKILLIYKKIN